MDSALGTPIITDQSVRSVNFFNGRLLSAEDLNKEKSANREGHKQLGRALGHGVAYGLEVPDTKVTQPTLLIKSGLAVNRRGRTLLLDQDVTLSLVRPATVTTSNG